MTEVPVWWAGKGANPRFSFRCILPDSHPRLDSPCTMRHVHDEAIVSPYSASRVRTRPSPARQGRSVVHSSPNAITPCAARGGARCGGSSGSPMCASIRLICVGSHTRRSTRRLAPQGHCRTSVAKLRCISSGQEYLSGRVRGDGDPGAVDPASGSGCDPQQALVSRPCPGTISSRLLAAGASTPWYVRRCRRGGGTCAASRDRNVSGSRTTAVRPFFHGWRNRYTTWPHPVSDSRSWASGGLLG